MPKYLAVTLDSTFFKLYVIGRTELHNGLRLARHQITQTMGEALPSSIQAIVANCINQHDNLLHLIDRIKADHEEQRRKLKNRITS
jgi:hypothetical protein